MGVGSVLCALAALVAGDALVVASRLPLARAARILAGLTIPMMLLALGYSLTKLKVKSIVWPLAFSALRLIGGFAIGWGVALALGITGVPRGVLVIESAMPVAVYNYMFAARYKNRPEDVAGLVVLSTAMSFAALPVFLSTVL